MKRLSFFLLALCLCFGLSSAGVLTYGGDAVSRYIFRGVDSGNPIGFNFGGEEGWQNNTPAVQPGLSYAFDNGLSLGLWSSVGIGPKSSKKLDELDLTITYPFKLAGLDYKIGYTHYTFPSLVEYEMRNLDLSMADATKATAQDEQFIGVAFNNLFLAPSLTIYNEYTQRFTKNDETQYAYTELGLTFPTLPYSLTNSILFGFDGTKHSNGSLSNINYKIAKDLNNGLTGYTNLILLTGQKGMTGVQGSVDPDGKRQAVNNDSYEIVFGLNYTGLANL